MTDTRFRSTSLALLTFLSGIWSWSVMADTPVVTASPPAEDFVGETFCFDAGWTNTGSPGYGPYYQIITKPDYSLASADLVGLGITAISAGTFPASPGNELTDPISGLTVTGPAGGALHVVRYPIGSVVAGQPSLDMTLCFDVDSNATINVLEADAFELVPVYEFGDTATGANGPTIGSRLDYDFTPVVIRYSVSDILEEMENPPGPAWAWNIEVIADIASNRTVTPIDFNTVTPINLPANVQFVGPVTFTGSGVSCTANTPASPPPENPGGSITLNCASGTGTIGEDQDIRATFPVYIVDTLDELSCGSESAINTAKHVTILKDATGGGFPGSTVTFAVVFQVSEFVPGISRLELTDVLPDGMTFDNTPTLVYGGAPVAITPTVSDNSPGTGQTTIVYDITSLTGALTPATAGFITYTATIDQSYDGAPLAGEPVRARDSLTNSIIGEYDITSGANNCSDDSVETVTIADVQTTKEIIGTSTVQPGDSVLWRLRLTVPSGDVQGIQFNDYFPLPVFDVDDPGIGIDTSLPLSGNVNISLGPGDTAGLEPTNISVNMAENRLTIDWPDVDSTMGEIIEVDVLLTVSSDPFADGLTLSNLFQAITDNSAVDGESGLDLATITLQQPVLEISKTATSAATQLEAGDSVSFDIDITNSGSAEAYDLTVNDTLPAAFTSCSLGAVVGGSGAGDIFSAGYTFSNFSGVTPNALDPGDSVTLSITCNLASTAENNTDYENTAGVVWAGQPGATLFPIEEDTATVSTRQTQSFKAIVATSEAHTDDTTADTAGDPRPVVTGEIVRYRTWAYLPQGTIPNTALRDLLPDGLEYIAGSLTFAALVSDSGTDLTATSLSCSSGTLDRSGNEGTDLSTLALDCVINPSSGGSGSGSDPVFNIGTVVNTEDDANEELVVLEFNARVVGDQAVGTEFNNRFRLSSDNGSSTSAPVVAVQRAPEIAVNKLVTPDMADGEDTVEYIVILQHSTSTGDEVSAFDVAFTDIIQPGLTYAAGTGVTGPQAPAVPGTDTCTATSLTVDDADPSGAGITITFDTLAPGDVCEVRYSADTASDVVPGQAIINTAVLDYTSLPDGGTLVNPTGSAPGAEASLQSQDTATLTIDTVDISKAIIATSRTFTTDATADSSGDPRPVAIGETLTYRLTMRLPEGNAPDYQVTDLLPAGLTYIAGSARIAFVFDGAGSITATPAVICGSGTLAQTGDESNVASLTPTCTLAPSGGPFSSGIDPIWDLGDLSNTDMDADDEFVIIEFEAQVNNEIGNQSGTELANSFELSVDASANTSMSVFAEVVEPALTLSAAQDPDPVNNLIDATPIFGWDITLANTGTATAFQIDRETGSGWQIILPVGVENITALNLSSAGNVFLNGTTTAVDVTDLSVSTTNNTNDTLTFSGPLQMAAGASLTIEFDANLLASVEPGDTPTITEEVVYAGFDSGNSATGIRDDADIATGSGNTPITSTINLNDYRTEFDLLINTTPEAPTLEVDKTVDAGPVNNGDGTFSLTYLISLTNSGNVNLENVAVSDDFDALFGAGTYTVDAVRIDSDSTSLTADASFTGAPPNISLLTPASSTLPVTESGSIEIDLTVTPGANLGPLTNTGNGSADSTRSTDTTTDDGTVDVTFDEGAEIGLAKNVSVGPSSNGDGSYSFTYLFVLANSGAVPLTGIQVTDLLDTTFAGVSFTVDSIASATFDVDTNYDGLAAGTPTLLTGTDTLNPGDSGTITVSVTVTPGANLGPYNNTATAAGNPPSNNTVTDTSDNGVTADGNGNGDPTDDSDPTPITFVESPQIGIAKALSAAATITMTAPTRLPTTWWWRISGMVRSKTYR